MAGEDPIKAPDLADRATAERVAGYLGCSGAHQLPDGTWGPCESPEALRTLVRGGVAKLRAMKRDPGGVGEPSRVVKRRRRAPHGRARHIVSSSHQGMGGRGGMVGIDTIQAGLVTGSPIGAPAKGYRVYTLPQVPVAELEVKSREHNASVRIADGDSWRYTNLKTLRIVYDHALRDRLDPIETVDNYLKALCSLGFDDTMVLRSDLHWG